MKGALKNDERGSPGGGIELCGNMEGNGDSGTAGYEGKASKGGATVGMSSVLFL